MRRRKALGVVREVAAGGGATVRVRAFPARFSNLQPELKGIAPELGEHTQAVGAQNRSLSTRCRKTSSRVVRARIEVREAGT